MTMTLEIASYIVNEFDGDFETEHRKGSSFYANSDKVIDRLIVDVVKEDMDTDISEYLGKKVAVSGYWSDEWGTEWEDFLILSKKVVHKPEEIKIIPAHDVIVWGVE